MRVKRATQYVVVAPGRPAQLARLTKALTAAGVELAGVVMTRAGESVHVKFVAAPRRGLRGKLESKGLRVVESPVLVAEGEPLFALLDRAAHAFADAGIELLSCYRCLHGGRAGWVFSVDKLEEAAASLQAHSAPVTA